MSQQKQAPLPRQEFQEWLENAAVPVLVLQKGKHLGSVVKVPATPEIDYLFGCETFYGERISWSDRLEFCGLYDRQHQALHLLDDPLPNFVSGLTEEECQDSTAFGKRIAQEVDRYVEAAISNDRSRLSVRELTSERNINSYRYYKGTEAGREAASLVFSGEKPDVQFHSEYYTSLTEDTLLSYLKSPEDYIKTTAEQYMRDNQEEFLAQFLKKDALLAEYQMLSQDSDAPVYRMRAITDALKKSGAKTVNVTVQKDGVELTFKTSAESLKGLKSQYSTWYIAPSDRLQFRHLFGAGSDYSAEDIIRIAYGRSTLYEAPSAPAEDIEMQGMSLWKEAYKMDLDGRTRQFFSVLSERLKEKGFSSRIADDGCLAVKSKKMRGKEQTQCSVGKDGEVYCRSVDFANISRKRDLESILETVNEVHSDMEPPEAPEQESTQGGITLG